MGAWEFCVTKETFPTTTSTPPPTRAQQSEDMLKADHDCLVLAQDGASPLPRAVLHQETAMVPVRGAVRSSLLTNECTKQQGDRYFFSETHKMFFQPRTQYLPHQS